MTSLEGLRQQLKNLLVMNHGDIKITEHPNLISDARELGLNAGQLSQLIQQLYSEIDWKPFEVINTQLEIFFRKGIITAAQFEEIVTLTGEKIKRKTIEEYVISEISKRGFKPRETNHPETLSFQNKWMTDRVWEEYKESLVEVEWLGKKANSLSRLGEISFQNKEEAKYFLRNGNYLPGLITVLTKSASKADEFARIIEGESDPEKKYLRIIYKLNPRLPFQFEGKLYSQISELLLDGCKNYEIYYALMESYVKEELQIWIQESDPAVAANLDTQQGHKGFLRFLYTTNPELPFFINRNRYETPAQLTEHAKADFTLWPEIAKSISEKKLNEWFLARGHEDWNEQLENSHHFITQSGFYTPSEVHLGVIQALFYITDPLSGRPRLTVSEDKIQLLSINGGLPLKHSIRVGLKTEGFIKVKVYFKFSKEGISLDSDILEFNSLEGKTSHDVDIAIDTFQLKKEELYQLELVISSVYEDLVIPVDIKVIFPKKAYVLKLVQYSLLTALYFGAFRYFLSIILGYNGWLVDIPHTFATSELINRAPLLSFFLFLLFILGGIISFKLIKKFEKI